MTDVDLLALDATAQAALVRSGDVSARELIELTLERIEQLDPAMNAFRSVRADAALADADAIDAATSVASPEERPLSGVPVAIKDDSDVAGEVTAWGSAAQRPVAAVDAEVVARLRAAGAVIIGKTHVPELTLWPWTASSAWGTTRNPWDLDRTPGGSSGGSAVAVCTGMSALALGSDGGGSIRYPAGLTGLVGVKPQRDRIPVGSEHGSGWNGLLTLGPLTRSVRDAALFLDVVTSPRPTGELRASLRRLPDKLRVALCLAPPPGTNVTLSAAGRHAVDTTVECLRDLGHRVVEIEIDDGLAALWSSTVRLLKGVQQDVATLADPGRLEARTRRVSRLGRLIPARSLARARRAEATIAGRINAVFEHADIVLTPLCATPAPRVEHCPSTGAVRSLRASNTSAWLVPWNVIGQPAAAIPAGLDDDGMPTAVQLAGRAHDEATVLRLAAQLEGHRPFPRWTPTNRATPDTT